MSVLHVCCALADGRDVPHSAAMLHSVLGGYGGGDIHIHCLHATNLPDGADRRLAGMVEAGGGSISFVRAPDAATCRLSLPELLPDLERVLFLHVNAIVVDSLDALWSTDLDQHYLAAVTGVLHPDRLSHPEELGLPDPRAYFDAGVMLLNLELLRRDGRVEAMRERHSAVGGRLPNGEQDTLNVVLASRRRPLHPRWNLTTTILRYPWSPYAFNRTIVTEAIRNPAIRQFDGHGIDKPWHYMSEAEMRELYFEHRSQTPWPHVELEAATRRNVFRRKVRTAHWHLNRLLGREWVPSRS